VGQDCRSHAGDAISGTIDAAGRRTAPVTLAVTAGDDPVYAARGVTTRALVFIRNWQVPTDTTVLEVGDDQGWCSSPRAFTATLEATGVAVPISITVPATATLGQTVEVTVTATSQADPNTVTRVAFQVHVALVADLALKKTGPDEAWVETPFTYKLQVTNYGPDAASGATLVDTLPLSLTLLSFGTTRGSCEPDDSGFTCMLGTIENGATATVTASVTTEVTSVWANRAEVISGVHDPDEPNSDAVEYTSVGAQRGAFVYLPLVLNNTP
jgi:uncharacterized repeat protein (TIGR01451 family)